MLRIALAVVLAAATFAAHAEDRTVVIPPRMERAYDEFHYAPATRVGNVVYVSGIPAGPGKTYEEQVDNLFKALERTLAEAGATMDDVVEIMTFHAQATDSKNFGEEFAKFAPIHAKYFRKHYPSWTAVGTTALLQPGSPVELKATAIIGSGKDVKVQRAATPAPKAE